MCESFNNNRKLVSNLVFEKRCFTADEIIAAYKEVKGNAIIDGVETIRGFIRGLEDYGVLRVEHGRYVVNE